MMTAYITYYLLAPALRLDCQKIQRRLWLYVLTKGSNTAAAFALSLRATACTWAIFWQVVEIAIVVGTKTNFRMTANPFEGDLELLVRQV